MSEPALVLSDLRIALRADSDVRAVDGLNLAIGEGEAVGLVGESGCGKSVTAYAMLGLLPSALGATGTLSIGGRTVSLDRTDHLKALRGNEIAMIFQDPGTSLNPVMPIGAQLGDVLRARTDRRRRKGAALELLERVGVPSPNRVARSYPFELSGGMRQRVLIAMAVSCRPRLLIADEPTTALDTTVQAQIMELLAELVRDEGMAMLFISHDLGLVAQTCQRLTVMYGGRAVESGDVSTLLRAPEHPYSHALVSCLADLGSGARRLATVPGSVPPIESLPEGCHFAPRCAHAIADCRGSVPPLRPVGGDLVACIRAAPRWLPEPGLSTEVRL